MENSRTSWLSLKTKVVIMVIAVLLVLFWVATAFQQACGGISFLIPFAWLASVVILFFLSKFVAKYSKLFSTIIYILLGAYFILSIVVCGIILISLTLGCK